jgi:D-lactate dehydrogenase
MRVMVMSIRPYERPTLEAAAAKMGHTLATTEVGLNAHTAALAVGFPGVCAFVNDVLDEQTLQTLHAGGTRAIALRSAGFNNVDVRAADRIGLTVLRVPAYSPHAVAEHAVALVLALNRHLHRSFARTREGNFDLAGLVGFDLHGKTVGVVGTGRIGAVFCRIMAGFGCRVLAMDPYPSEECRQMGVNYVEADALFAGSDIVSLHCPLSPETKHLIGDAALERMKRGVMIINTSRGAVIDTGAAIRGLKNGRIGALGLDVYEEEGDLFFRDLSDQIIQDDVFARLLTFPNVVITAHQAFLTREALTNIAETTMGNFAAFEAGRTLEENRVGGHLLRA